MLHGRLRAPDGTIYLRSRRKTVLKARVEADVIASCGTNCVAGEESSEVDYVEAIVEVVAVDL